MYRFWGSVDIVRPIWIRCVAVLYRQSGTVESVRPVGGRVLAMYCKGT